MTFHEILLVRIYTVNVQDKMGAKKYLEENYYHHIKYSITNFLTALMRK